MSVGDSITPVDGWLSAHHPLKKGWEWGGVDSWVRRA
jgi:hypothetical protein